MNRMPDVLTHISQGDKEPQTGGCSTAGHLAKGLRFYTAGTLEDVG